MTSPMPLPRCRSEVWPVLHTPVMPEVVADVLAPPPDALVVDLTFGRGGHARRLLAGLGPAARYVAIDRDPEAVVAARELAAEDARVSAHHRRASELETLARELGIAGRVHAVLADLGVSSPQLEQGERGFSFLVDGPLDMRMDTTQAQTAARWINRTAERDIAAALREYGEERFARRIARAIVERRKRQPFADTTDLADVVARAHPAWERHRHPATRTFQAIRIAVNNELDEVRDALVGAARVLQPGGRLAFISFHSLEDRIVKRFIRDAARAPDPFAPQPTHAPIPRLRRLTGAVRPAAEEVELNPRARSAVLRAAERLAEPDGAA